MKRIIYILGLLFLLSACSSEKEEITNSAASEQKETKTEESKLNEQTVEKTLEEITLEKAIEIDHYNLYLINQIVGSVDMYYYGNFDYFYSMNPELSYVEIADDLTNRLKPYMTEEYIESYYYDYITNHCVACDQPFTVSMAKEADSVDITIHNENEFTLHSTYEPKFLQDGGTVDTTYLKDNGQWKIHETNVEIQPSEELEPPAEEQAEQPTYTDLGVHVKGIVENMVSIYYQDNGGVDNFTSNYDLRQNLLEDKEMYEKNMDLILKYFDGVSPLLDESQKIWEDTLEHSLDVIAKYEAGNNIIDVILGQHYNEALVNRMSTIFDNFGEELPKWEEQGDQ